MWARAAAPLAWTTTSTMMQVGAAQKRVCRVWLQGMVALPRAAGTLLGTGDSRQGCARRLPQTAPARPG